VFNVYAFGFYIINNRIKKRCRNGGCAVLDYFSGNNGGYRDFEICSDKANNILFGNNTDVTKNG